MGWAVSDQFARHGVGNGGVVRGQPGVTRSDAPGSRDRAIGQRMPVRTLAQA